LLLVAASVALLAAACSSSGQGKADDTSAELGGLVKVDAPRVKTSAADAEAGAAPVQAFATDAYGKLIAAPASRGKNVVLSPYSIEVALAMARAGAKGDTATEMDQVLHAPSDGTLNKGLNGLDRFLASLGGEQEAGDRKGKISLDTANALWGQLGDRFKEAFLHELATEFGAGMHTVDFSQDAEGARKEINAWVAQHTSDRITDLLAKGTIDPDTRLVLTNAIYLKAPWAEEFAKAEPADFHLLDGSTKSAPLMSTSERMDYAQGDGYQAVSVPYLGSDLAMTVIVPDTGRFNAVEQGLDSQQLRQVLTGGTERKVDLKLPTFDLSTKTSLKDLLTALGMPAAFDAQEADFTGITDPRHERLFIGDVIHEANITVDEKGTEASAATAVTMEATAAPEEDTTPVELTVDRPFLFVVHDTKTGTPLFMGRVLDPTQK
jgi:serpin B